MRRILGEEDLDTLQCRLQITRLLVFQKKLDVAREMHARLLPVISRVLGPDHVLTARLRHPDFLVPP